LRAPSEDCGGGVSLPSGLAAVVPGLVHETLLRDGRIADPLIGEGCFACEWVEHHAWIYRTRFEAAPVADPMSRAELVFAALDGEAEIFLNGALVATHRNSYRPLTVDVSALLKTGENCLEVRLELGVDKGPAQNSRLPDGVAFATEESLGYRPRRGEPWRIFQRKPAYGFGWDWSPRVSTLGIVGPVCLRLSRAARVENLLCATLAQSEDAARVRVAVELEGLHYYASAQGALTVEILSPEGEPVAAERRAVLVRSGFNELDFEFDIARAQRWWPNGHGAQPLYTARARLEDTDGATLSERATHFGIRTVRLLDAGTFHFEVNGVHIFAQGGNFVPPDALYTRADDARYETIVRLAAQAHMNILRVWGGGNYERDIFYDACDRAGLLVWQDFMFACSPYPDHEAWFRDEIAQEARYQVRRLASHPCMALWCGSNENTWAFCDWWSGKTQRGARLYNDILPRAVRANAPHIAYWTGSPYGGATPNEQGVGNNHFWKEWGGTLCPDAEGRTALAGHDACRSFFISEYGYQGPCSLRETRRFLGEARVDRASSVWHHHTNTRRYAEIMGAALKKIYGVEADALSVEDYLLYGSLWQGVAYGYSLDAARFRPECSGAIVWMLNEAWGEAGWGIIDNALGRKTAWYFVRRALAAQRLILRADAQGALTLALFAQVPTGEPCAVRVLESVSGKAPRVLFEATGHICAVRNFWRIESARTPGALVWAEGAVSGRPLESVLLWPGSALPLLAQTSAPRLEAVLADDASGEVREIRLSAQGFAHAVHIAYADADAPCDEQYFDLFPGETRTVRILARGIYPAQIHVGWLSDKGVVRQGLAALTPIPAIV